MGCLARASLRRRSCREDCGFEIKARDGEVAAEVTSSPSPKTARI